MFVWIDMGLKWHVEEDNFLKQFYPNNGQEWCAEKLNRTKTSIRSRTSYLKLKLNPSSTFFKEFQSRAAKSKMGKKRPTQSLVMQKLHEKGKLNTYEQKRRASIRLQKWRKENSHPQGMMGKKHTQIFKKTQSIRSKKRWQNMTSEEKKQKIQKMLITKHQKGNIVKIRVKQTWKAGWREFGGKKKYYRSLWEANYGRYLEFLKTNGHINDWFHEPEIFLFKEIKKGNISYLPDFKIINNDDSIEYHEVKGWMDKRSEDKIKRMAKYYPDIVLKVIKTAEYNLIKNNLSHLIEDWEWNK